MLAGWDGALLRSRDTLLLSLLLLLGKKNIENMPKQLILGKYLQIKLKVDVETCVLSPLLTLANHQNRYSMHVLLKDLGLLCNYSLTGIHDTCQWF